MVPWQIVRYGAAAELLGLGVTSQLTVLGTLGESLIESLRVVLGSDLATLGFETRVDPVAQPLAIARTLTAIEAVSGPELAAWWRTHADATHPFVAGVRQEPRTLSYTLAYDRADAIPAALATRLGALAAHVERVTFDQREQCTRFDVTTTNVDDVVRVLEASHVQPAQLHYLRATLPVWTLARPEITIRVAARDHVVLDQVGVRFRAVPGEQLASAWTTLHPSPDAASRIGAVVGAIGTDIAERFEIRCSRTEPPQLEATFVPVDATFSRRA